MNLDYAIALKTSGFNACCQVARTLINPVAPSIVNELFWSTYATAANPLSRFCMANRLVKDYTILAEQLPSLPQRGVGAAVLILFGATEWQKVKEYRVGALLASNANKIWQTAHVALLGMDIYAGDRVRGITRLVTWTYLQNSNRLPPQVKSVVDRITRIALVITIAAWCYDRPYLTLGIVATAITVTAVASIYLIALVKRGLQYCEDNVKSEPTKVLCRDLRLNMLSTALQVFNGTYLWAVPVEKA